MVLQLFGMPNCPYLAVFTLHPVWFVYPMYSVWVEQLLLALIQSGACIREFIYIRNIVVGIGELPTFCIWEDNYSLFYHHQETVNSLLRSTCMIIIIFMSLSFTVYFMFYCLL